jgi:hypothetical protein
MDQEHIETLKQQIALDIESRTGATGPSPPPQALVDLDTYLLEFAVSQPGPTGPTGN